MSSYLFVLNSLGSGIESTVIPREARNVYYSAGGADMKARAAKRPAYVALREGLTTVAPDGFSLFDQLLKGFAMLYLNNGTSATYTPITFPAANRPGS